MNKDLILALLLLAGACLLYFLKKSVAKNIESKTLTSVHKVNLFKHWLAIIACVLMSIIYFCKSV